MTAGSNVGDAVAHTAARRQTLWSSHLTKAPERKEQELFNTDEWDFAQH